MNKFIKIILFVLSTNVMAFDKDYKLAWDDFIIAQEELYAYASIKFPQQFTSRELSVTKPSFSKDDLDAMIKAGMTVDKIKEMTVQIRKVVPLLQSFTDKEATAVDPEVSVSACKEWTDDAVYGLTLSNGVLGGVLAGLQWSCELTEGGFNSALACLYPEVTLQAFAAVTEIGDFCVSDIAHGVSVANYKTNNNIAKHLNSNMDVDIDSRASMQLVDSLTAEITSTQQRLDDYFPVYFPAISQRQSQTIADANEHSTKLQDLQSRHQSMQQQQIILNARLVDIDERTEDSRLGANEIRQDTQFILQKLTGLNNQVQLRNAQTSSEINKLTFEHMALVLAQVNGGQVVNYQIPAAFNGKLEEIREFVYQSMTAAQSAGFNTSSAQTLFATADGSFNQGSFKQAYLKYAQAYQAITSKGMRR